MCVCVCVWTDGGDRLHAESRLSGDESEEYTSDKISASKAEKNNNRETELGGLHVPRSKALQRNLSLVLVNNTWHIKAPGGNEFQRSTAGGEPFVLAISEIVDYQ